MKVARSIYPYLATEEMVVLISLETAKKIGIVLYNSNKVKKLTCKSLDQLRFRLDSKRSI